MNCPICGDNLENHDRYKLEMCCLVKLIDENKNLKDFIEGNEFDLTLEFRRSFPDGIR